MTLGELPVREERLDRREHRGENAYRADDELREPAWGLIERGEHARPYQVSATTGTPRRRYNLRVLAAHV